jgi:hypothetical protein
MKIACVARSLLWDTEYSMMFEGLTKGGVNENQLKFLNETWLMSQTQLDAPLF